jgi:hypothetical protein
VEDRLLGVLWLLAERWGRVGGDGVRLPLPLTHRTLAQLVGAQRPSVTSGIGALEDGGRLARLEGGGWLLRGAPPIAATGPAETQDGARRDAVG